MTDFSIHRCKGIQVARHQPCNANVITLAIEHEVFGVDDAHEYREFIRASEITLFDLPTEVTDILLEHFGNPNEAEEAA